VLLDVENVEYDRGISGSVTAVHSELMKSFYVVNIRCLSNCS
jgi:hypothetical protein